MSDQAEMNLSSHEVNVHRLAEYLAKSNIDRQLEQGDATLQFLLDIEGKTAEDEQKVVTARKVMDVLHSESYFNDLRNAFAEHYSQLAPQHLQRFLDELDFEEAVAKISLGLSPVLRDLHDKHVYGVFKDRVLQ